jgi:feruloyl-CoA synthase
MTSSTGAAPRLFAPSRVTLTDGGNGTILLRSSDPLGEYPVSVVHSAREHARLAPDHPMIAEKAGGGWRRVTYAEAIMAADATGQGLLERGLGPDRPLLILSGNSVDHLLMTLGAMTAGIPVVPVSVAYSRQSHDHKRIREIAELIKPGAVFAEDADAFGPALDMLPGVPAIVSRSDREGATPFSVLQNAKPGAAVEAAFAGLRPDGVAKILLTSGSTGAPKGVLNTHRMLAANQQMIRQVWPFLAAERPVIVDWLPWSHTFGGNHNVNMALTSGGTLYVDGGRPVPGMFAQTVANLADVPPTIYFNVPAGFAQLVPALEADPDFASRFFSRLRLIFNAAAALPPALSERLATIAKRTAGRDIAVTGSWGATETAPAVTSAHYAFTDARCIGIPLPGTEVKLVPSEEGAYEIRVKGPNVTPGYFARPDLTGQAFDGEGFYRTGDAVAFADPDDPNAGLVFRSRMAEDFKLETGTFVRVGALRTALLSAIPVLADVVLAGENRDCVCALAWLNPAEARALLGGQPEPDGELIVHDGLRAHVARALADHNSASGSAARVQRLLVMARPASLDDGEVTDKGYLNQRRVLTRRSALVDVLYSDPASPGVITAEGIPR